ncbi:hypothetical protein J6590_038300 [Homalodisca vitripennis]|nr:hypothetical protein J6590_038300 [Homalodisca vitripennis]
MSEWLASDCISRDLCMHARTSWHPTSRQIAHNVYVKLTIVSTSGLLLSDHFYTELRIICSTAIAHLTGRIFIAIETRKRYEILVYALVALGSFYRLILVF